MERPPGHPQAEEERTRARLRRIDLFSVQGMTEALNLNEEQAKKMHQLLMDYRKGVIQKGASLRIAMIELEEMVASPKLDLPAIEKKAKEREAAATELTMLRVRAMAKAKDFLSDAQFDQFRNLIERQMTAGRSYQRFRRGPHGTRGMGDETGLEMGGRFFSQRGEGFDSDGYDEE